MIQSYLTAILGFPTVWELVFRVLGGRASQTVGTKEEGVNAFHRRTTAGQLACCQRPKRTGTAVPSSSLSSIPTHSDRGQRPHITWTPTPAPAGCSGSREIKSSGAKLMTLRSRASDLRLSSYGGSFWREESKKAHCRCWVRMEACARLTTPPRGTSCPCGICSCCMTKPKEDGRGSRLVMGERLRVLLVGPGWQDRRLLLRRRANLRLQRQRDHRPACVLPVSRRKTTSGWRCLQK